ncbi:hypothetical protein HDV64DRAFT_115512 [Trichoderma sp. TUCIM 5745]
MHADTNLCRQDATMCEPEKSSTGYIMPCMLHILCMLVCTTTINARTRYVELTSSSCLYELFKYRYRSMEISPLYLCSRLTSRLWEVVSAGLTSYTGDASKLGDAAATANDATYCCCYCHLIAITATLRRLPAIACCISHISGGGCTSIKRWLY